MRILFALPGLHLYDRGAEIAFISIASELARGGDEVTLIGAGRPCHDAPYRFLRAPTLRREYFESFPSVPVLRSEYAYEELAFLPSFLARYRPSDYDVTVTASYPFTNWALRRPRLGGSRPPHVFVTQNGDWPARAANAEYLLFSCDGLVCINPDYFDRNKVDWRCCLIPNGVNTNAFTPGPSQRMEFGLPSDRLVILMVSALISTKRVECGIEVARLIPDAHLVVAGDGPLRANIEVMARRELPGRFSRLSITAARMPTLYRSADVFLHLSKEEAFGNVFVEAMACGLPVVAHDSPRTRWIVGEDEYLADTDDVAAVARQIQRAHASGQNEQTGRVMRAQGFSWPTVSRSYLRFFAEVIAASAR
jgi:glycosyltransferase involved in cell wall biosynthesis